jgi:hypothetical protein
MFFDVVFSIVLSLYFLLIDVLNLAIRPLLPISALWTGSSPGFVLVASGTLLFGALASATAFLVAAAVMPKLNDAATKFVAVVLFPDGVMSCAAFFLGYEALYPAPRTFVGVMFFQLNMLPTVLGLSNSLPRGVVECIVSAEVSLAAAVTARRLFDAELFAGPILLLFVSGAFMLYAVVPRALLRALAPAMKAVQRFVSATYARVRRLLVRLWPFVRVVVLSAWLLVSHHPAAVFLERWVLTPSWRIASPLVLPAINAVLAVTLFRAVSTGSLQHPILLLAQLFCAASSALCAVVLSMHA